VPLNDITRLYEWVESEDPLSSVWSRVEAWVQQLATNPWQYPSQPLTPGDGQPWEIRAVQVPGTNVEVVWEHEHATGMVNLLRVGTPNPPPAPQS
jgi:hypothetical protein